MKAITETIATRLATSDLPIPLSYVVDAYPTVDRSVTLDSVMHLVACGFLEVFKSGPVTAVKLTKRGVKHAQACAELAA